MRRVHMMCSELQRWLRCKDCKKVLRNKLLGHVRVEFQKLKALVKESFGTHCKMRLNTLKLDLLDNVIAPLKRLGARNC